MFGMNPAAWLKEHHREHTTLIAEASIPRDPGSPVSLPSAAPQLVCC